MFKVLLSLIMFVSVCMLSSVLLRKHAATCAAVGEMSMSDAAGLSHDQITSGLLESWLAGHEVLKLCPVSDGWIWDYSITASPKTIGGAQNTAYLATFSVRPLVPTLEGWGETTGTLDRATGRVEGALIYFTVERRQDKYVIVQQVLNV